MKTNRSFGFILLVLVAAFALMAVLPMFAQTPSTIYGRVYNDANANRIQDAEEAVMPGVTVMLDDINQSITDADGYYVFHNVPTGAHTIRLTVPSGYVSTTSNPRDINVAEGNLYGVFFGIIRVGVVSGVVFNDNNENGIRDPTEWGWPGATVKLDGISQVTNNSGSYLFRNLAPGEHIVEVTVPLDTGATTPSPVSFNLTLVEPEYQVDFGLKITGAVHGIVYNDANANRIQDLGEVGVAGVNVTLARVSQNLTSITGHDGDYSFSVFPDLYRIELNVPVGYFATTPTKIVLSVTGGNSYEVNFGIKRDIISPVTSHNYDGSWHTQDFNITLTATDTQTGVSETFYKINGGPTRNVTADGQPRITVEGANNTLEYWSIDNAGNEELPHKILTNIKLDKIAPTIDIPSRTPKDYIQPDQAVGVSVNVTDFISGVKQVALNYTSGNETWVIVNMTNLVGNVWNSTIPAFPFGTNVTYAVIAEDNAYNTITTEEMGYEYQYHVIPEFPTWTSILLLLIVLIAASAIHKRR